MKWITDHFESFNNASTMWIWFLPAAALTFFAAKKMVIYASGIIEKTKLGALFVGVTMVSVATSIPELITEITQGLNGSPEIGLADDIGANAFSTLFIGIGAIIFLKSMFLSKADRSTKISILFSLGFAIAYTIVFLVDKDIVIGVKNKYAIGLIPIIFLMGWIGITVLSYFSSKKASKETTVKKEAVVEEPVSEKRFALDKVINDMSKRTAIIGFSVASFALIIFSLFLNISVDGLAHTYSIDKESAGGIFLSMTTAMPEVVAFIYFAKRGEGVAAIGSIIGSHIFNLSAIFYGDLAYAAGPIITAPGVDRVWTISLMVALEVATLAAAVYILPILPKKFKNKVTYLIAPIIIVLIYAIGWVLILSLY